MLDNSERHRDADRKRDARAKSRDIHIPEVREPNRRADALADVYTFLPTYFPDIFYQAFTNDRREMIDAIERAVAEGGDQAIAGPRGEGKTRIALFVSLLMMLRHQSRFPLVIGKNQKRAARELKNLKEVIQFNSLLADDFPELCYPIRAMGGWASRALMQTYKGEHTRIEWAENNIVLPTIPSELLGWESVSSGQIMASVGWEGPIRGLSIRNERPTLVIFDDLDDRESASSEKQTESMERVIEDDAGGVAGPGRRISRVMLCTMINRVCTAAKYTDPKLKPSWSGIRFRAIPKMPDNMDLWNQYVELRSDGKPDEANELYRNHRAEMDAGAVVSNESNFTPPDLSALQFYFNIISDRGMPSFQTEYQNDPPEEAQSQTMGLTEGIVANRLNGLPRGVCPPETEAVTAFVDLGKRRLHWAVVASARNAAACVVDYGVHIVSGFAEEGVETALLAALRELRDSMAVHQVDSAGELFHRDIDLAMVDAGHWNTVAYEFVRESGPRWRAAMGIPTWRPKRRRTSTERPGFECWESRQKMGKSSIWVVNQHTDYWKRRVHEGLLVEPRREGGEFSPEGVSLFGDDSSPHRDADTGRFAWQLVGEIWQEDPPKKDKPGKAGWRYKHDNHYLDCMAGALCAAGIQGIRPVGDSVPVSKASGSKGLSEVMGQDKKKTRRAA